MSETTEPTTKPAPTAPLSQNEWDRLLKEAGWRDATLDGPTAFELPGFPDPLLSRKSQPDKPAGR
jgi:hypothetical protein